MLLCRAVLCCAGPGRAGPGPPLSPVPLPGSAPLDSALPGPPRRSPRLSPARSASAFSPSGNNDVPPLASCIRGPAPAGRAGGGREGGGGGGGGGRGGRGGGGRSELLRVTLGPAPPLCRRREPLGGARRPPLRAGPEGCHLRKVEAGRPQAGSQGA